MTRPAKLLTPEAKILQTVSVPHNGNRFWWAVLNASRAVFGATIVKPETEIAWTFAAPHRTVVFVRDPVAQEISFRNRDEESLLGEWPRIFALANERTVFLRTDCPADEREAGLAMLQAVVDASMSEQAALGYTGFKQLRHPLATTWKKNPDHSVSGDWTGRRDEVLADLRSTMDLTPFRALGYEV